MGIGATDVLVPIEDLNQSDRANELLLSASKQSFENASEQPQGAWASAVQNEEWADGIDAYYGQPFRRNQSQSQYRRDRFTTSAQDRQYTREQETSRTDRSARENTDEDQTQAGQGRSDWERSEIAHNSCRASTLIGKKVTNDQNESLGEVKDLIINLRSGQAPFAVIATGGIAGLGKSNVLVPLRTLRSSSGKQLMLSATEEQLQNAPQRPDRNWTGMEQEKWAQDIDRFFTGAPHQSETWNAHYNQPNQSYNQQNEGYNQQNRQFARGQEPEWQSEEAGWSHREASRRGALPPERSGSNRQMLNERNRSTMKASSLIGRDVRGQDGESVGNVSDLIVDLQRGAMPFAIISYGGALGIGETDVLVPVRALRPARNGDAVLIAATKAQFMNARQRAQWQQGVDAYFGQASFQRGSGTRMEDRQYTRNREENAGQQTLDQSAPDASKGAGAADLMQLDDRKLERKIQATIDREVRTTPGSSIHAKVDNGVVQLYGKADSQAALQNLKEKIQDIKGVKRVQDDVTIQNR